jgi:hypothetical protein
MATQMNPESDPLQCECECGCVKPNDCDARYRCEDCDAGRCPAESE